MFLGELIYKYRKDKNLTMDDFAKLSGLSKGYISMLEKNQHPQSSRALVPSVETFKKVAAAMNIDPDELFRIVDGHQLIRLNTSNADPLEGLTNVSFPAARSLPILGNICAGNGVFCEENYEGTFFVDASVKADLCVRVHGDSMIDAGIFDNDMAFIKKDYDYGDGKIYAVRINSDCEAVLKKVTLKDNVFVLAPCNASSDYQVMLERSDNVSIIGECVGVYHSCVLQK